MSDSYASTRQQSCTTARMLPPQRSSRKAPKCTYILHTGLFVPFSRLLLTIALYSEKSDRREDDHAQEEAHPPETTTRSTASTALARHRDPLDVCHAH